MQGLWCLDVAVFMFMTSTQCSLYNKGFAIRWCLVLTWGGYLGKWCSLHCRFYHMDRDSSPSTKISRKLGLGGGGFTQREVTSTIIMHDQALSNWLFLLTCFPKELSVVCRCPWLNQSVQLSALVSRSLASMDQEGWVVHRDSVAVTFCTRSCHSENISPVSLANGEDKGLIRILVIVSDKSSQEIMYQHKPCGLHLYLETESG